MEDFYSRVSGFKVTDRASSTHLPAEYPLVFLSRDPQEHHQLLLATGRPAEVHCNVINQIRIDGLPAVCHFHSALHKE
jgi:hypothetical protein